ncbi:MAG TPA: hypothetical protein ENI05_00440 [Porticoccus sp.]|nr:hypothetical protein [Porticoccus sp.]
MAETYDVYFGLVSGSLELVSAGQSELSISVLVTLEYNTAYQWRVDATNEIGTTTGDVWTFTTMAFDPPVVSGGVGSASGLNNMATVKRLVAIANNKVFYET